MDESLAETSSKQENPPIKPVSCRDFVALKKPRSDNVSAAGDLSDDEPGRNPDPPGPPSQNVQIISLEMEHMKRYALARCIQEDPKAADLKWSMFCAACQSYRYDSVLKPFPPFFFTETGHKDIDRLREVTESCPTVLILHDQLQDRSKELQQCLLNLLYWVLIHLGEPGLKYVPKSEHGKILSLAGMSDNRVSVPNHVMEVVHNDKSRLEQKFEALREEYGTKFAYHGSRLDNFYSILNHGLQISLNKTAAFGPGVYLSSEMNISLSYSPAGFGWGGSHFGSRLSVVALCEMVDHVDVKFQNGSKENFCKMIAHGSENGPVPKKYFIVQNSDLVRVRYLLVFGSQGQRRNLAEPKSLLGWIREHKMITIIVGYVVLLLAVGTSNSAVMYRYYRRFLRKLGFQILNV